jgi:hypothetical protein
MYSRLLIKWAESQDPSEKLVVPYSTKGLLARLRYDVDKNTPLLGEKIAPLLADIETFLNLHEPMDSIDEIESLRAGFNLANLEDFNPTLGVYSARLEQLRDKIALENNIELEF